MRKLITSVAFLSATSALACSFSVGTKEPQTPQQASSTAPAATTTPAPVPTPSAPQVTAAGGRVGSFGKGSKATSATTASPTGTNPAIPPAGTATAPTAPAGIPVMSGANPFGSGTPDPNGGWKGTVYWIPAGTTKMPALGSMTANGILFASTLNVANQAMTTGFPGIDPSRNQDFAIRFEAPLLVENEADYEIRVLSDDGAIVSIDGMPIVDNDGAHDAKDKTGPVHLVRGTHLVQVDYFQGKGNVALQLFVKKSGAVEQVFPNKL